MNHRASFPYIPGIEVLKRKLTKFKINLYLWHSQKIISLIPSNIKPESKSEVYKITCDGEATHVGETTTGLDKRMDQHQKLIEKDEEEAHSKIVQHHHSKRCQCMFDISKAANQRDYLLKYQSINQSIYQETRETERSLE